MCVLAQYKPSVLAPHDLTRLPSNQDRRISHRAEIGMIIDLIKHNSK